MVCNQIVCVDKIPQEEWKLFFGDTGHITRSDKISYKVFQNIYEKAFSDFWTWKVVDFSHDSVGWENIEVKGQRVFLLNNAFQTLMDSGVYNEYFYLVKFVSNPELATLYSTIGFQEVIHSNSYSYGLAQMFGANVEDKFNLIYTDDMVKSRMTDEIKASNELMEAEKISEQAMKLPLLKSIFTTLYLENVKFPLSFYSTWAINDYYGYAIQGFSQLLKLIAFDELTTHVPTNKNVLNIVLREKRQGFFDVRNEFEDFAYNYVERKVKDEIEWANYLLQEGEFGIFTKQALEHFIKYKADETLQMIKLKPIFNEKKSDIVKWFNGYYDINSQNNANQEISNISYRKGIVKNDLNKLDNLQISL
jgi:ribonucleoside-diphosphate reductase beta chain